MRHVPLTLLGAACAMLFGSCSLLSKEQPVETRWFEVWIEMSDKELSHPIEVIDVSAAQSVGRDMVWRRSDIELVFDEANRWAEEPADYVERAFAEQLSIATIASGESEPVLLDIEVEQFGGIFGDGPGQDRAEIVLRLSARGAVQFNKRVRTSIDLPDDRPETLAAGLSRALSELVPDALEWVKVAADGA